MNRATPLLGVMLAAALAVPAAAQVASNAHFVNGITVPGSTLDLYAGTGVDRRLGMFSDIYYDRNTGDWWGLSDRGPGGGVLPYATRVERFSINIDPVSGQISNFQVLQTVSFSAAGQALNGIAPSTLNVLGNSFDPEGIVVNPRNGNLIVSEEYGPSVAEFDRDGNLIRRFTTPANIIPRNTTTGNSNFGSDTGNNAGETNNHGFEGLAISPDGQYAYAMLQSAMLDEGAGNGVYTRIVKFDVATGQAVGQYAYQLASAAQGRGISSLVALGNDKFMVLERNNRGVGVGATVTPADKSVFEIDLAGATDISNITLTNGVLPPGVTTVSKSAQIIDLDANTLSALGNKSPEKWESLAVGPRLTNGSYLILTGTDNDYSVTQSGSGQQYDVYFDFTKTDPYAKSIQCPIGTTTNCFATDDGSPKTLTAAYSLLPGVLQGYTLDINGYVATAPEPATTTLLLTGMSVIGFAVRRRKKTAA
jgi:hypothetical protein